MEFYDETPPNLPDVSKIGTLGWLCVAGFVAGFDIFAKETMSHAFERGLNNKYTGPLILTGMGYLCCHLAGIIPDRADFLKHLPRL